MMIIPWTPAVLLLAVRASAAVIFRGRSALLAARAVLGILDAALADEPDGNCF